MTNHELYFSTDIETDGPIPGPHSMLSLGSAAFSSDGVLLGTFSINLKHCQGQNQIPKLPSGGGLNLGLGQRVGRTYRNRLMPWWHMLSG